MCIFVGVGGGNITAGTYDWPFDGMAGFSDLLAGFAYSLAGFLLRGHLNASKVHLQWKL
jgi:hypothetical protein